MNLTDMNGVSIEIGDNAAVATLSYKSAHLRAGVITALITEDVTEDATHKVYDRGTGQHVEAPYKRVVKRRGVCVTYDTGCGKRSVWRHPVRGEAVDVVKLVPTA